MELVFSYLIISLSLARLCLILMARDKNILMKIGTSANDYILGISSILQCIGSYASSTYVLEHPVCFSAEETIYHLVLLKMEGDIDSQIAAKLI